MPKRPSQENGSAPESRWRILRPRLLTFVSSVLIVLAFPPYGFYPLVFIALAPWLVGLSRFERARDAFIQGVWMSFLMSMLGFQWVAFVLHEYGELPWPLAVLGLLLYSLGGQPQFLLFAPLYRASRSWQQEGPRRALVMALALALVYAGLDWFLPKLFCDTLGHALFSARWLRQAADIGGALLLTLVIFLSNHAVAGFWLKLRARGEPSLWPLVRAVAPESALAGAGLLFLTIYGHSRLTQIESLEAHPKARVQLGVIQANIGDFDKISAERGIRGADEKVMSTFFTMSDEALKLTPKPQALIWPETSYPGTFRTPRDAEDLARDQKVENFARSRGIPLYFGGYDHVGQKDFNAFFFLSPKAEPALAGSGDLQIYRKHILLLFGEYIPGMDSIKWLRDQFPQVGNFGHGGGPQALDLPLVGNPARNSIKAGPIICYEALFPWYIIEAARKGSELILNITNDSWFGYFGEPPLHLALTAFRSIETRLPELRSTNTGISALILPNGDITHASTMNVPQIINLTVPVIDSPWTLLKNWGDWFGPFAFFSGFLLLLTLRWQACRADENRLISSV